MGAYVALLAADARPDLFRRLVLIDGGVPLPLPAGVDPDEVLAATLGPALERLEHAPTPTSTSTSTSSGSTPPSARTGADGRRGLRPLRRPGDAGRSPLPGGRGGGRADGRDLLVLHDEIDAALRRLALPTHLLCAPLGMFGQAPGLLPAAAVTAYAEQVDALTVETVPDVNHYTIAFDPVGTARVAAAITG